MSAPAHFINSTSKVDTILSIICVKPTTPLKFNIIGSPIAVDIACGTSFTSKSLLVKLLTTVYASYTDCVVCPPL